jgi:gamma-glutamylputrescine oxidase
LPQDLSADFLVVGAGYAGLMAALTLAQSGARVKVVDAGLIGGDPMALFNPTSEPSHHPTQSMISGGHVVIGFSQDFDELSQNYGLDFTRKFYALSLEGVARIETLCQSIDKANFQRGYLILARNQRDENAFLSMFEDRARLNLPSSALLKIHTADETKNLISSPEFTRGSFYSNLSGQLEPQFYLAGLARMAEAAGAQLIHHTKITHFEWGKDVATAISEDNEKTTAKTVIISGGTRILQSGLFPRMRQYQAVIGNYALKTDVIPDHILNKIFPSGYKGAFCDMRRTDVLYARLDKDNRLDFGAYSFSGLKPNAHDVINLMYKTFPQLKEGNIGVYHGRYGFLCGTKLETMQMFQSREGGEVFPSYYFDNSSRITILSAFGGAGINLGTTAGRAIAEAYLGQPDTINILAKIRHPKLPITLPWEKANQTRDYVLTKALSIIDKGASQDGMWGGVMRNVEKLI